MPRRPPVSGEEPHTGEGYLGSVSDLMAALIFVFILTLAVFALRLAQERQQYEDKISKVTQTRTKMLLEIERRLVREGIEVEIKTDQGVLHIREKGIYFESGAPQPTGKYKDNVGTIARVLSDVLPCYASSRKVNAPASAGATPRLAHCSQAVSEPPICEGQDEAWLETVLIEGHTDSEPFKGGLTDNLDLSSARAGAGFRIMTECEPALESLSNSNNRQLLGVSGYAERRPVSQTDNALNRRIDLRFMMELPKEALKDSAVGNIVRAVSEGVSN